MSKYNKGRRYEYKTIELFESMGEQCIARNAGSHRISDLVFATPERFRLVQVKSGTAKLTDAELAKFHQLRVPKDTVLTLVEWKVVGRRAEYLLHDIQVPPPTRRNRIRKPVHRE